MESKQTGEDGIDRSGRESDRQRQSRRLFSSSHEVSQYNTESIYTRVLKTCKEHNTMFTDPTFCPSSKQNGIVKTMYGEVKWCRASKLFEGQEVVIKWKEQQKLKAGCLTGEFFINAVTVLARRPLLIRSLFQDIGLSSECVYGIRIQKNGVWEVVVIDDWIPVVQVRDNAICAGIQCAEQKNIWPSLLEKAYAKLWNGYDRLEGGNPLHALRDLTGAPYTCFKDLEEYDLCWERIKEALSREWIVVGCTVAALANNCNGVYTLIQPLELNEKDSSEPIRAIKADFRSNNRLKDRLLVEGLSQFHHKLIDMGHKVEEGEVWLPLEHLRTTFDSLAILFVEENYAFTSATVDQTDNPHSIYYFSLSKPSNVTVALDQIDKKAYHTRDDYQLTYFRITVAKVTNDDLLFVDSKLSAQKSLFVSDELPEGSYIVMVEGYWHVSPFPQTFTLGLYSSSFESLKQVIAPVSTFLTCEYLIWQNFSRNNRHNFQTRQGKSLTDSCEW